MAGGKRTEIELKFLEIDTVAIRNKLEKIGAKFIYEEELEAVYFKRRDGKDVYDTIRLRRMGERYFLTLKKRDRKSTTLKAEEEEHEVDGPAIIKKYREEGYLVSKPVTKRRIHYELDDLAFEIDSLPGVPTYLEIEAFSDEGIDRACTMLGLKRSQGHAKTMREVYPEALTKIWE